MRIYLLDILFSATSSFSPDLSPVDYKIRGVMQHRVYQMKVNDLDDLKCHLTDVWAVASRALATTLSTSGINVSAPVFEPDVDTSNIRSDFRISQTLRT